MTDNHRKHFSFLIIKTKTVLLGVMSIQNGRRVKRNTSLGISVFSAFCQGLLSPKASRPQTTGTRGTRTTVCRHPRQTRTSVWTPGQMRSTWSQAPGHPGQIRNTVPRHLGQHRLRVQNWALCFLRWSGCVALWWGWGQMLKPS
jgi:hypothetical protein